MGKYLQLCLLCVSVSAYRPIGRSTSVSSSHQEIIDEPVIKSIKRPLLTVIDPLTRSRIHLVGVSHGSASSAALVKEVFTEVNPAAVILELCDDRFWSISLDAKIRPRGNETLAVAFDNKLELIENWEIKKKASLSTSNLGMFAIFSQISNVFKFASGQGLIGGTFVLLGLFVASLQRLTRQNTGGDEFVTAMLEAEKLDIPVRLGDAPQNDTLNSIKDIISVDVFNPVQVVQGAGFLAFSAFGLLPGKSNRILSSRIPEAVMKASEWVSIPKAYFENSSMLKSLLPIFAVLFVSTALGFIPLDDVDAVGSIPTESTASAISTSISSLLTTSGVTSDITAVANTISFNGISILQNIIAFFTGDLPPEVEAVTSTMIDIFSVLVLIRMSKIIGTDRDCIIAKNVQTAAKDFPGQDIVVVIGMLHCNGVARWLLSGVDPLEFNASPMDFLLSPDVEA